MQGALRIGPVDQLDAESPVSSRESRSACRRCPPGFARLIAKVYEADPLICRHRGSPMRIVAVITEPQQVRKILRHLVMIGRSPPGFDPASLNPQSVPLSAPGSTLYTITAARPLAALSRPTQQPPYLPDTPTGLRHHPRGLIVPITY